jgi:hypothetical protein
MVRFLKLELGPDDKLVETKIRILKQSDIGKCPHCIFAPEHYREDGSCKCDDHSEVVMAEWGYHWNGKRWDS